MLAFLAAIIPIVGSLYVATSYLVEQARLAHEHRARHRIVELVEARRVAVSEEVERSTRRVHPDYVNAEAMRFALVMLRAYGLPEEQGSYTENDVRSAMSGTLESITDRRRQWVLLLSSMVGLVLLAIDALL